jgi:LPS O-antigen subunit length determinant protein (WzzB/FepE family)
MIFENNMQNNELNKANSEISAKDLVAFVTRNFRLIAIGGLTGLLLSAAYVQLVPGKYEARVLLRMAQFANSNNNTNGSGNDNSLTNIEEPAALIQRLRYSTAYPVAVQQSCRVREDEERGEYLGDLLDVRGVKNVPNAVEMRIYVASPDLATKCAETIVGMIAEQQNSLINDRLAGRQEQLQQYQQDLREEQKRIGKDGKSELAELGYLAKLDRLSWLRTRIDGLTEEALLSQKHPAKLAIPIMVSSKPVSPKTYQLLLLGTLLGVMLGLLYALGREGWGRAV